MFRCVGRGYLMRNSCCDPVNQQKHRTAHRCGAAAGWHGTILLQVLAPAPCLGCRGSPAPVAAQAAVAFSLVPAGTHCRFQGLNVSELQLQRNPYRSVGCKLAQAPPLHAGVEASVLQQAHLLPCWRAAQLAGWLRQCARRGAPLHTAALSLRPAAAAGRTPPPCCSSTHQHSLGFQRALTMSRTASGVRLCGLPCMGRTLCTMPCAPAAAGHMPSTGRSQLSCVLPHFQADVYVVHHACPSLHCCAAHFCAADDANTTADNLAALLTFYDRHPAYRNRTLFLAGESYSGATQLGVPFYRLRGRPAAAAN